MLRCNLKSQISQRRSAFRLALCLALSINGCVALADSGCEPSAESVAACDLPEYPFPASPQFAEGTTTATSGKVIIRLLGFSNGKRLGSPMASQSSTALPMSLPNTVDLRSQPSVIPLPVGNPSQAQASVAPIAYMSQPSPAGNSAVVVAKAIQPDEAVHASLSDKDESDEESKHAMDLLHSLDDLMQSVDEKVSTSIERTDITDKSRVNAELTSGDVGEGSAINLNISDNCQASDPSKGETQDSAKFRQLRQAESSRMQIASPLVGKRDLLSSVMDAKAIQSQSPTFNLTDSSPTSSGLPVLDSLPRSGLQSAAEAENSCAAKSPSDSAQTQESSSRREVKTASLPISTANEPIQASSAQQIPLLPMLASATGRSKLPEQVTTLPQATLPQVTLPQAVQSQAALPRDEQQESDPQAQASLRATSEALSPVSTTASTTSLSSKAVNVMVKDAVALQSAESIQAVSVEHENICQVIRTGDKSCSVIGLRPGETRVAIINENAGQRTVEIHQVIVGIAQTTGLNSGSLASSISQTIQQLYPRSNVRIATRGSQLVVSGSVDSEDTARKILSLVRKTTLTPVVDELQTR